MNVLLALYPQKVLTDEFCWTEAELHSGQYNIGHIKLLLITVLIQFYIIGQPIIYNM